MGEWLTSDEAANRLKVSGQTMRNWMRHGQIPAAKMGRVWRVSSDTIEDFLKAKEVKRPAQFDQELEDEAQRWQEADLASLPAYDWGDVDPMTLGKPVKFVRGVGLVVIGGKGDR